MKDPQENPLREAWILCLILGLVMLNFPFIQIFNNNSIIFGIPSLVFYLFSGWLISIVVIYLFIRQGNNNNGNEP